MRPTNHQNNHSISRLTVIAACALLALAGAGLASASQGCPFDDGSCQEYCSQQGCNMGYCGHFAWIQCICRKCGDEWSWYDKVRYNPDKTVNQTELDSLKLNGTTPLILTNSSSQQQLANSSQQQQQQQQATTTTENDSKQQQQQKTATLTTLLIPDLSDGGKLDLNDIPDENSDKFLDYLAKNHEKLVQATSSARSTGAESQPATTTRPSGSADDADDEETGEPLELTTGPTNDDDAIEIQISATNSTSGSTASTTTAATTSTTASTSSTQQPAVQSVERLLRMAVAAQRASDDID